MAAKRILFLSLKSSNFTSFLCQYFFPETSTFQCVDVSPFYLWKLFLNDIKISFCPVNLSLVRDADCACDVLVCLPCLCFSLITPGRWASVSFCSLCPAWPFAPIPGFLPIRVHVHPAFSGFALQLQFCIFLLFLLNSVAFSCVSLFSLNAFVSALSSCSLS